MVTDGARGGECAGRDPLTPIIRIFQGLTTNNNKGAAGGRQRQAMGPVFFLSHQCFATAAFLRRQTAVGAVYLFQH